MQTQHGRSRDWALVARSVAREFPLEKLLRDARAALIEDGCNEALAIKGGACLMNPNLLNEARP